MLCDEGQSFPPWGGEHQNCLGKTACRAVTFSDQMCETILRDISVQLRSDKRLRTLEHGIYHVHPIVLDGNDEVELGRLQRRPKHTLCTVGRPVFIGYKSGAAVTGQEPCCK